MSVDSTKAFLERVKNDEDFRKEVGAQTSKEERMKFVKAQGFDFTKEEIDSLKDELSDEQLEGVDGGWSPDMGTYCRTPTCPSETGECLPS